MCVFPSSTVFVPHTDIQRLIALASHHCMLVMLQGPGIARLAMAQQQQQQGGSFKAQLLGSLDLLLADKGVDVRANVAAVVLDLDQDACAGLLQLSEATRQQTLLQRAGRAEPSLQPGHMLCVLAKPSKAHSCLTSEAAAAPVAC